MPKTTEKAERSATALPLCHEGETFFAAIAPAHRTLRTHGAALADSTGQALDALHRELQPLRRCAMRASLAEDDKGTKGDVDMLDRRYATAEELVRRMRATSVELAQLLHRIEAEGAGALRRVAMRAAR